MNPTMLIRSAAATLAATTFLFAQSAPAPVPPKARSDAKASVSTERLQVRLAEVIAMLDEDELTPEQRAEAKKKLTEIVAKLRAAPAPTPPPAMPTVPEVVEVAPLAPAAPPAPKAPRAVRAPRAAAVTPPSEVRVLAPSAEGGEGATRMRVIETTPGGEWRVSERAKVEDEARTLYRAAEKMRADVESMEPKVRRLRAVEAEQKAAEGNKLRKFLENREGDDPVVLQLDGARARKVRGQAAEMRAEADDLRAKVEAETRGVRERFLTEVAEGTQRVLKLRAQEAARADAERAEEHVLLERVRARDAKDAKVIEVQPMRGAIGGQRKKAGAGDDDIRQIVDEMRAEMREIREMLQALRKQSQSNARKPGVPSGSTNLLGLGGMRALTPVSGQGVPVLGDVPVLNSLFSTQSQPAPAARRRSVNAK